MYINKNLKNRFIIKSQSLIKYLMLFILRKRDSKLRIVINYQTLNKDTIKNRYLLLLIMEI